MTTAARGLQAYVLRIGAATDNSVNQAFGRLNRQANALREDIRRLDNQADELTATLRQTRRGTQAYEDLENQIEATRRESRRLTQQLDDQNQRWDRFRQAGRRAGTVAAASIGAVAAVGGGVLATLDRMAEGQLRFARISEQLNIPLRRLQETQFILNAQAVDFDPDEYLELANRLGEAQREFAQTGNINEFGEALQTAGFDLATFTTAQIPDLLDALVALRQENVQVGQSLSDIIFGGPVAEQVIVALASASDELRDAAANANFTTERQIQTLAESRRVMQTARAEVSALGVELATSLAPSILTAVEAAGPIIRGFAEFAANNRGLVASIPAVVVALGGLASAIWLVNAANAARLALQGPTGWVVLGAAAGLLAAGGLAAAGYISAGNRRQEERERVDNAARQYQARLTAASVGINAEEGSYRGTLRAGRELNAPTGPAPLNLPAGEINRRRSEVQTQAASLTEQLIRLGLGPDVVAAAEQDIADAEAEEANVQSMINDLNRDIRENRYTRQGERRLDQREVQRLIREVLPAAQQRVLEEMADLEELNAAIAQASTGFGDYFDLLNAAIQVADDPDFVPRLRSEVTGGGGTGSASPQPYRSPLLSATAGGSAVVAPGSATTNQTSNQFNFVFHTTDGAVQMVNDMARNEEDRVFAGD